MFVPHNFNLFILSDNQKTKKKKKTNNTKQKLEIYFLRFIIIIIIFFRYRLCFETNLIINRIMIILLRKIEFKHNYYNNNNNINYKNENNNSLEVNNKLEINFFISFKVTIKKERERIRFAKRNNYCNTITMPISVF